MPRGPSDAEDDPVKFCADHWERLRDAVKQAGLWSLVAANGDQAARNFQSEVSEPRKHPKSVWKSSYDD